MYELYVVVLLLYHRLFAFVRPVEYNIINLFANGGNHEIHDGKSGSSQMEYFATASSDSLRRRQNPWSF